MKEQNSKIGGLFRCSFSFLNALIIGLVIVALSISQPARAFETFGDLSYEEAVSEIQQVPNQPSERDITCLARNIYFEARGESTLGQKAVAFVTLNRVNSQKFSDSICGVVHQRVKSACQFAWVCNKMLRVRDFTAFEQAKEIAFQVITMYTTMADPSKGALYFSGRSIQSLVKNRVTAVIGNHVFYR